MQWASILDQHPPMVKLLAPVCTSKGLSNFANLSTGGEENLVLSSLKTWWQGSSHFWDSHFLHKLDKVGQPSSFMLLYAMAIHFASTSANAKVTRPRMHLKRFVKVRELKHGRRRELVFELPKGLVTRLIPLLG
jgi:hypothetical protein